MLPLFIIFSVIDEDIRLLLVVDFAIRLSVAAFLSSLNFKGKLVVLPIMDVAFLERLFDDLMVSARQAVGEVLSDLVCVVDGATALLDRGAFLVGSMCVRLLARRLENSVILALA